ncbi:sporulation protein [Novosphingobium malaysiense]|uniref:Sporulation protein n=1 Tax=Novosphingobium malaysiense TaxID=1348853 RepID=A0A0B1ZSR1_9SPHN|nr:sporulation protein [Novosphingobium malaysiense]
MLACALPAGPARADVKAGVDAWSDGDYDAAVREWKPLARKGDPDAQFNLAQAYKMGRGVPMDAEKAKELYGKAAAHGHLQAADIYGLMLFQHGERERAMPYIKASAERGDPRAQYILGLAHFNGDLAEKDWVRAYALVSLAREAGLPQATRALQQMDTYIPLEDRQKSVILSTRLAAEAQATRERLSATAELGTPENGPAATAPKVAAAPAKSPEIVSAERAVAEAARVAGSDSPATAGADYARPKTPPAVASRPATKPAPAAPAPQLKPKPSPETASGPWRVQLGAFGVAGNADALWSKVQNRPELAGHGKLLVPAGRLTKLQAGGFASKVAADAACAHLSAGGFACIAVRD